jgi:hypothetical protein
MDQKKTVCIGKKKTYGGRTYRVFCKIKFKDGVLSISGVEGPLPSGNALGGCGQIDMDNGLRGIDLGKGWTRKSLNRFLDIWDKWHLNDMNPGCEHQDSWGETYEKYPGAVCPVCKWKLGHGWHKREVPQDIIDWLFLLPDTDVAPAWV